MKHLRVLLALSALSLAFGHSALGHPVFGQSVLGEWAGPFAPTSASAEEGVGGPASRFFGFVFAEPGNPLPTKVRAIGDAGVVCGTASVAVVGENLGFYDLRVTGQADRTGCPAAGERVSLWLLYGKVDDGVPATTNADARFVAGGTSAVSLGTSGSFGSHGWAGAPPPAGGTALMRWNGPDGMPVAAAVGLLGVDVRGVWHFDSASGSMLSWVPDAPSFVQTYLRVDAGDIVVVRAR